MHLFEANAPEDMDAAAAVIPVLDLSAYLAGEDGALEDLARELRRACTEVGFFYLSGHGIDQDLIAETFDQSKRFHALPLDTKMKLPQDENNIGYLPMNASIQRHSTVHKATRPNQNASFFVTHDRGPDHPDVVAGKPYRSGNQWPDDLPGFREKVMAYFHALNALGDRLLPVYATALDLAPDYFDDMFANEGHQSLRMLHYPPTEQTGNDFGTSPHTDNTFMTILARMDVPGLAIRLPSGEWVTPPLIPGTFLVNIGNILRRMSNDTFLSTPHGVVVEGDRDRYSLAYFHSPNPYSMIEVLPSCIDDDHPPKYEPVLYADLIREFFSANYAHQKGHGAVEMKNRYD